MAATYLSFVVSEWDAKIGHGSEDGHQRLNSVAVDDRSILFEVIRCETTLVDNSAKELVNYLRRWTESVALVPIGEQPRTWLWTWHWMPFENVIKLTWWAWLLFGWLSHSFSKNELWRSLFDRHVMVFKTWKWLSDAHDTTEWVPPVDTRRRFRSITGYQCF